MSFEPDYKPIVPPADSQAAMPAPTKTVKRKSLWVLIRALDTAPKELNVSLQDAVAKAAKPAYTVYKCTGVEEVRKRLLEHEIDASNMEGRVLIFRAEPVEVTIKKQLIIRF